MIDAIPWYWLGGVVLGALAVLFASTRFADPNRHPTFAAFYRRILDLAPFLVAVEVLATLIVTAAIVAVNGHGLSWSLAANVAGMLGSFLALQTVSLAVETGNFVFLVFVGVVYSVAGLVIWWLPPGRLGFRLFAQEGST